jgi:hypothetical protein
MLAIAWLMPINIDNKLSDYLMEISYYLMEISLTLPNETKLINTNKQIRNGNLIKSPKY